MSAAAPTPAEIVRPVSNRSHRKGEIYRVVSNPDHPPVGNELWADRPAVVLSADRFNDRGGFAMIAYTTTSTNKRSSPSHVPIIGHDGSRALVLCEQVTTVDASRLVKRLGQVSLPELREIEAGVTFAMALGRNPDTYGLFRKWESHIKAGEVNLAEEIAALSGKTADERVRALTKALELTAQQRDAYAQLLSTSEQMPRSLEAVRAAMAGTEGKTAA